MRALLDVNVLIALHDANHAHYDHIDSPRQLSDLYLLALAVTHQGRVVTFDQRIPLSVVREWHPEMTKKLPTCPGPTD